MKKLVLACKHTSRSNLMGVYNGVIVENDDTTPIICHRYELESQGFKWSDKHHGFIVNGLGLDRFLEIARALGFKNYETI